MSYSFNVTAASKSAAIEQVEVEMRKVVSQQPVHNKDDLHAIETAKTFINMLDDDDRRDVRVSMNGSIYVTERGVQSIAIGMNVNLQDRPRQAA